MILRHCRLKGCPESDPQERHDRPRRNQERPCQSEPSLPSRSGGDHPGAKNPRRDQNHGEQDAPNDLINAWDSEGAHAHDYEIKKRECAKEDVADTANDIH